MVRVAGIDGICRAADGPPGPSTANFVAIVGSPGLTMAAGPTMAAMDG